MNRKAYVWVLFASRTTEDRSACICMHFLSSLGWLHHRHDDLSPRVRCSNQYLMQPSRVRCDFPNARFNCRRSSRMSVRTLHPQMRIFCLLLHPTSHPLFFCAARTCVCLVRVLVCCEDLRLLSFLRIPRFNRIASIIRQLHAPHYRIPQAPFTFAFGCRCYLGALSSFAFVQSANLLPRVRVARRIRLTTISLSFVCGLGHT